MADERLMTVGEFNQKVTEWAHRIKSVAKATLSGGTHSSGTLEQYLTDFVNLDKKYGTGAAYSIKFWFERYGVFRHYGAGRGWVVDDGILKRGYRVRSYREIQLKQWNEMTAALFKRGYTKSEINQAKVVNHRTVLKGKDRKPLNWIDQHLEAGAAQLADIAQEFYADMTLDKMLEEIRKMKIEKK